MISRTHLLTYIYLFVYILLSSGVILYNKWVLSPKYFNFPFPITLTMIHMGFSSVATFILVRVFKVVSPVKMTLNIYATCVIPISAFFASSLWFGNTAYLHISVAFIQMLKALMPLATFMVGVLCGTEKLRCDVFLNMMVVSVGVVISSYGEIHFNMVVRSSSSSRAILSADWDCVCSFVFLSVPWFLLEKSSMGVPSQIPFNLWIFLSSSLSALALNFSIFLVLGRTGAVTVRVAGVLKDWILIALSTVVFPESTVTPLNLVGYAIALCGVIMYNYLKMKEVPTSELLLLPADGGITRTAKHLHDWKLEKKSSDVYVPPSSSSKAVETIQRGEHPGMDDEEAASLLAPGQQLRMTHIGRTSRSS